MPKPKVILPMTAFEKRKHRLANPKVDPDDNNKRNTEAFKAWLFNYQPFTKETLMQNATI